MRRNLFHKGIVWQRLIRAAASRPAGKSEDPHMLRLRDEGYSNHQIAIMTGRPLYEVNLEIGPHDLKGRAA